MTTGSRAADIEPAMTAKRASRRRPRPARCAAGACRAGVTVYPEKTNLRATRGAFVALHSRVGGGSNDHPGVTTRRQSFAPSKRH
jgi:hypothetical protein